MNKIKLDYARLILFDWFCYVRMPKMISSAYKTPSLTFMHIACMAGMSLEAFSDTKKFYDTKTPGSASHWFLF